ncbi:MAG: polyprenol monophosphomannose synthase [Thermodesulfobacteriota bacterium]
MRLLIILPTYNEAGNLERMVGEVLKVKDSHVLVVDDNSTDGTGEIADKLAAETMRVSVLHRSGKLGLASAYIEGFHHGLANGFEFIQQMDCDFSHDPGDITRLLREMSTYGADIVIGSRYVRGGAIEGWPIARHILSKAGNLYARCVLNNRIKDWTGGFNLFRAEVLKEIIDERNFAQGYAFLVEMKYHALKSGFKVREIPIVFRERTEGESKMGKSIVTEAAARVWKLRKEGSRAEELKKAHHNS